VNVAPLLVVVTGMPASGKTTVARALAAELDLPVLAKDEIKERLFDTLGVGDVEWSQRLGAATYVLIFAFAHELLAVGQPVIMEANFFAGRHEAEFFRLPPHRPVQVHCHVPLELLADRFSARADRHAGHLDRERVGELAERLASGVHSPLALDGDLIELDTSKPVDVERVADKLAATIQRP
jgi:predicted kinase